MPNQEEDDEIHRADTGDITDALRLAKELIHHLDNLANRHRLDLTGSAASALTRARTDEAMLELNVQNLSHYLGVT